jgi:hypothetical protein
MVKKGDKKEWFTRGQDKNTCCKPHHGTCGGAVYGLGFIGSLIYFVSTADSFWMGILGVLKAIVWPAVLVYGLLKSLGI